MDMIMADDLKVKIFPMFEYQAELNEAVRIYLLHVVALELPAFEIINEIIEGFKQAGERFNTRKANETYIVAANKIITVVLRENPENRKGKPLADIYFNLYSSHNPRPSKKTLSKF